MATDWIATLKEHGELAQEMARDVPQVLSHSDLTLDQASRIYNAVENSAQTFDNIVKAMHDADLDESLYEVAEAIEDTWSGLSIAAANRVRIMQGLTPIEFPDDDDD